MRTNEELIEFLHRVVGEEYITVNGDGDVSVDLKPYSYEITSGGSSGISGYITCKGERLEGFNNSGRDTIKTLIVCMNHSYSVAIKDCLVNDPDMLSHYKMSRFKFS